MLRKGDILYNPVSGETLTFLKTSADTQGALLQIAVSVEPGSRRRSFLHLHPRQQQTLRIRSGSASVTLPGKNNRYGPGETVIIPADTPHHWENASDRDELQVIWELSPAMHWETIVETFWALAQAGKLSRDASPPLLQLALTLNKYPNHIIWAGTPAWLQQAWFYLLSPLALLLGYNAVLSYKAVLAANSLPVLTNSKT